MLSELPIDVAHNPYHPIIIGSLQDREAIEIISEKGLAIQSVEILFSGIINGEMNYTSNQIMAPGRMPDVNGYSSIGGYGNPNSNSFTNDVAGNHSQNSLDESSGSNESSNRRSRLLLRGTSAERVNWFRARSRSRDRTEKQTRRNSRERDRQKHSQELQRTRERSRDRVDVRTRVMREMQANGNDNNVTYTSYDITSSPNGSMSDVRGRQ